LPSNNILGWTGGDKHSSLRRRGTYYDCYKVYNTGHGVNVRKPFFFITDEEAK